MTMPTNVEQRLCRVVTEEERRTAAASTP